MFAPARKSDPLWIGTIDQAGPITPSPGERFEGILDINKTPLTGAIVVRYSERDFTEKARLSFKALISETGHLRARRK
ncbi:hypothetical protein OHV05_36360 (plasmid) [Kitasatospora sp. NBC_00070]|uniref:hypothetical protein n=1 Tax=Kitasatospora sp. NBC_00070 TaxID=2975962 RepID=UPI002F91389C